MALQTKTFSVGDYTWHSWSNGYVISLTLTEESTNILTNTSLVSYAFTISNTDNNRFIQGTYDWDISIGNQTIPIRGFDFYVYPYNVTQTIASGSITVTHNIDGSMTMPYEVSVPNTQQINPYGVPAMSLAGTWELTTIPRASGVSCGDTYIGSAASIQISRASSGFTHTLEYTFGNLSGMIVDKTPNAPYTDWILPEEMYAQIPNAAAGTGTITCYTYSGEALVGSSSCSFRAVVNPSASKPFFDAPTVAEGNSTVAALTGKFCGKLVKYFSHAQFSVHAQARNGAAIVSKSISCADGQYSDQDTGTFYNVESGEFTLKATDSRGFSYSEKIHVPMVPYIKLTCNLDNRQPDGDGNLTAGVSGNFFACSFGAVSNSLKVSYCYRETGGAWTEATEITPELQENRYSATVAISGLDYRKTYELKVCAKDALMEVSAQSTLRAMPVFDWSAEDFRFHVPVYGITAGMIQPTQYDGELVITQEHATYENCVFNGKVTIGEVYTDTSGKEAVRGNHVRMINCTFHGPVVVNGAFTQLKNIFIGGRRNEDTSGDRYAYYLSEHCLTINKSATDIIINDISVQCTRTVGIYYASFGGSISNFSICNCVRYGFQICSGGMQIANGKIYGCGNYSRGDRWSGGLIAVNGSGMMKAIPELTISNLSVQQNFISGVQLCNVQNATIDITLLANCAETLSDGHLDSNGIYSGTPNTFRWYGVYLENCKNVSGRVNGVSCHSNWHGADLGYYDSSPSRNHIDVTWEACFVDTENFAASAKKFARFLPGVRADVVNGLGIGSQFTEADCNSTGALNFANILMVGGDGLPVFGRDSRKVIPLEKKVAVAPKGFFRIYVEAADVNIYPYINILNSNWASIYDELGVNKEEVCARGQRGVYSGTFSYDISNISLSGATYFYLNIIFNKTDSALTGTFTPKIRVQFYPY